MASPSDAITTNRQAARSVARLVSADAALALLVVAVVGLMIVPLPPWLLDVLLAANLAASVAVLIAVLHASDALGMATLPTLLLVATLVRLGLSVSATRLILGQARAGELVDAFGRLLVGGNLVVGAVVFSILALVQLLVVSKGAERVAEVGARFALDALPGRQMALDAEVRSGAMGAEEAERRRRTLARESQFHGAMDGAMKFVKGDAVAALVIALVNILGGLAVGVLQRGLAPEVALRRYGLLTIGVGLLTLIPALVLSVAAGVLITRVASDEPGTSLGADLARQFLGSSRTLGLAALFAIALAAAPGLPALPFLLVAALLLALWAGRRAELRARAGREALERAPSFVPALTPWSIEVGAALADLVGASARPGDPGERESLSHAGLELRERLFEQLGVPLPAPVVRSRAELPPRTARLSIFEVPAATVEVPDGLERRGGVELVRETALLALRSRAADLLGISEVKMLLDRLEPSAPGLARQVVPKPVPLALLADVLRRLLEEGVSVRDLRAVLEALADAPAADHDPGSLADHVRARMRRATTFRLTGGTGVLDVCVLEPEIEHAVRGALLRTAAGVKLALAPAASRDVVAAVRAALAAAPPSPATPAVLLTQPDIRRFVRALLQPDLPELVVISAAEVLPEVSLRPTGRATLRGAAG
jgi:type III secretion protein V